MPSSCTGHDEPPPYVRITTSHSLPSTPSKMKNAASSALQEDVQERLFNVVSQKLKEIGAIPLDDYLEGGSWLSPPLHVKNAQSLGPLDTICASSTVDQPPSPSSIGPTPLSERSLNGDTKTSLPLSQNNAISRLHQDCIHIFGSADPLAYDFVEENGQKNKQCILTITRPDGLSRSYKSEALFIRRADAKARVATIALQMGASEFIHDESEAMKTKKAAMFQSSSPRPAINAAEANKYDKNTAIGQIECCLAEWRAGKIKSEWIYYHDAKLIGHCGAALRIQLTTHSFRIYSCDSIFDSEVDAKAACAQKAIDEGVIDYIKSGNGQLEPAQLSIEDREPELFDQQRASQKGRTRPITLQAFYESLPRPFPEPFGEKTATEINAPSYINSLLQTARGGRIRHNFYWVTNKSTGLLGCLLRLERGEETKSYFADHLFQRRNDAKSAACLLALSQGLGDYIRLVKASMEANFTAEMRKLASEKFIFALNTECSKIRMGNRLNFSYTEDLDAFGASLEVDISSNPEAPNTRKWSVASEYRSKNDAKLAVCYEAISQGAIEILQFKGAPVPPGYVSYWDNIHGRAGNIVPRPIKRKTVETDVASEDSGQLKKRRKDENNQDGNVEIDEDGRIEAESATMSVSNINIITPTTEMKKSKISLPSNIPHTPSVRRAADSGKQVPEQKQCGKKRNCKPMNRNHNTNSAQASTEKISYESFLSPPETPNYPQNQNMVPHYPPPPPQHMLSPPGPSSMYYPPQLSPLGYPYPPLPMTEPPPYLHPPMYPHPHPHNPHFLPPYPQVPQTSLSPYHHPPMPSPYHSPYHSPYVYPSSPMYLPQSPDGRSMELYDYQLTHTQDNYNHHHLHPHSHSHSNPPQHSHQYPPQAPLHPQSHPYPHHQRSNQRRCSPMTKLNSNHAHVVAPMSPPSTPSRPPKIKRIDRHGHVLSKHIREELNCEKEQLQLQSKTLDKGLKKKDKVHVELESGEETETDIEETEIAERGQVLERRASLP